MPLNPQGYVIIDLPPITPEILESYERLPLDEYMGNLTRYKRFSQYRLSWTADDDWHFEKLAHRDYTAFKQFNPVGGGIKRKYEPLEADFTPFIRAGIEALQLDNSEDWQINVHQNRTIATPQKPGQLTPEGVHHDGHEFVLIGILRRHSVSGGVTRLWNPGEDKPFWDGVLEPGQAVVIDDRAIAHDVTDVLPENGNPGNRDIFITAFSRWKEKWYGDEHDRAVLEGAGDSPSSM
ncbi:2OG-Fe dioxygenase family protein [Dactylosporangium sp. NPDC051484]|uniref:2OG-Fe dioxygenase family protein n=1 Tax=Dactylosporangium sp. NPDC051484 TaxID=3154942 RepID=UPI00344C5B92